MYSTGGPREREEDQGGMVFYNQEGFLPIQNAIASAYVKLQSKTEIPKIQLQVSVRRGVIKDLIKKKSDNQINIICIITEIPVPALHFRYSVERLRNYRIVRHNAELCISDNKHRQIHSDREREATERGYEDNGPSELVALDWMVCQINGVYDHIDINDCNIAQGRFE